MRPRRNGRRAARLGLAAAAAATVLAATARPDNVVLSVGVTNGDQLAPCREIEVRGLDAVGGCELTVEEATMGFTVTSLFGDQPLARCPLNYRMRIGQGGSLALSDISTSQFTSDVDGPCGDILSCRQDVSGPEEDRLPWEGRLAASGDGSLHAAVDACFDTCLGRFEGRIRFRFEQTTSGAWRLWAHNARVGASGLKIGGVWTIRPAFGGQLTVDTE